MHTLVSVGEQDSQQNNHEGAFKYQMLLFRDLRSLKEAIAIEPDSSELFGWISLLLSIKTVFKLKPYIRGLRLAA